MDLVGHERTTGPAGAEIWRHGVVLGLAILAVALPVATDSGGSGSPQVADTAWMHPVVWSPEAAEARELAFRAAFCSNQACGDYSGDASAVAAPTPMPVPQTPASATSTPVPTPADDVLEGAEGAPVAEPLPEPVVIETPSLAPPPFSGTADDVIAAICSLPWPCDQMVGIAMCESGLVASAYNPAGYYGLFQINFPFEGWDDPLINSQVAYEQKYLPALAAGDGLSAWSNCVSY